MSAKSIIRSRWFMLLFSIGLFVLLAEIGLRVVGTFKNYGERNYGAFIDYTKPSFPGPLATWAPDSVYQNKTMEFNYEVVTNSLGLRDVEHNTYKPDSVKRIALLGDSFTEGVGTPFDSTWGNLLIDKLHSDSCGTWEAIQGSAAGSDPFYAYEMYRRHLYEYRPDVLLATYNHTDLYDYMAHGGLERFVNDSVTQWRPVPQTLHMAYKWSHLVRLVVKGIMGWNDFYQSPAEQQQLMDASTSAYADLFEKLNTLAQKDNAQLVVIIQPMSYDCEHGKQQELTIKLQQELEKRGIATLDLFEVLTAEMKQNCTEYFWEIDGHMNSNGYHNWAQAVYAQYSDQWCP